jgi:hypothetical protein
MSMMSRVFENALRTECGCQRPLQTCIGPFALIVMLSPSQMK